MRWVEFKAEGKHMTLLHCDCCTHGSPSPRPGIAMPVVGAIAPTLPTSPIHLQQTITITIVDDTLTETNEAFTVTLSNPTGATLDAAATSATVTILANDVSVFCAKELSHHHHCSCAPPAAPA